MTNLAILKRAAEEASWLVERGFPADAVSEFVATHRALDGEQRKLLQCNARLNANYRHHIAREMDAEDVRKRTVSIDVASAVSTVAAALAGRDLLESSAGVHLDPTWTRAAAQIPLDGPKRPLDLIAGVLDELRPTQVRLVTTPEHASRVEATAAALGKRKWKHAVVPAPDVATALSGGAFIVSSDPAVLDACATWVNVVALAIDGLEATRLRLNP